MIEKKIKFIAHRGYSGIAPENSIPAFFEAEENGFWGTECDVWETKSKDLLIMHDRSIKRMCGVKKDIRDLSEKNREKYPIVNGQNADIYKNLLIPTFEEYLNQLKDSIPVIELKALPKYKKYKISDENLNRIKHMLKEKGKLKETFFISFSKELLLDAKKQIPESHTMYLTKTANTSKLFHEIRWCSENKIDGIDIEHSFISKDIVQNAHAADIKVAAWPVNNHERCIELKEMGVDFITSDYKYFYE